MFQFKNVCDKSLVLEVFQPLYYQGPGWLPTPLHTLKYEGLAKATELLYHVVSRFFLPSILLERLFLVSPLSDFLFKNHLILLAASSVFGCFTLTSLFLSLASPPEPSSVGHIPTC